MAKDELVKEKLENFKQFIRSKATKDTSTLSSYDNPEVLKGMVMTYLKPMLATGGIQTLANTMCDMVGIDCSCDREKVGRYLTFFAEACD